ncbi:hypothetical protein V6N12_014350 [Hibiscus sabdariffa]|uniref:Uncharacterized protein n=1 Tax=Hibiscus sabdariffa TaxID=183260 RepID=A0ABR2DJW6_9ROSI
MLPKFPSCAVTRWRNSTIATAPIARASVWAHLSLTTTPWKLWSTIHCLSRVDHCIPPVKQKSEGARRFGVPQEFFKVEKTICNFLFYAVRVLFGLLGRANKIFELQLLRFCIYHDHDPVLKLFSSSNSTSVFSDGG